MLALAMALALAFPPVAAPPATLVVYERTGGFAGLHDHVSVDRSGRADTGSRTVALPAGEFAALRRELAMITTYGTSHDDCNIADHFTYTLTYRKRSSTRCRLPDDWRPAVARLDGLLYGNR